MRVKAKRKEGESLTQFLKRFLNRYAKSGLALEIKDKMYRKRKMNERRKYEARMYRLKLMSFIKQKLKEGMPFEKAYELGKRYINYIKYTGRED
ncbi:MAG: hypothetical protein RQ894_01495 [Candidatus Pacebacteria bacterium]|jgi:hypothetical protein|nr:hypothetical protein [Candidatus Paceibacterota bacterium]